MPTRAPATVDVHTDPVARAALDIHAISVHDLRDVVAWVNSQPEDYWDSSEEGSSSAAGVLLAYKACHGDDITDVLSGSGTPKDTRMLRAALRLRVRS